MYTAHFGLREAPFSIAPDPQYLYPGQRDREALAHFEYGISVSGGFVQLTGEVGTGKTLLVRTLLDQLPGNVDAALVLNPVLTAPEFVATICDELRIDYPHDTESLKRLVDALNAFLLQNHAKGRKTVLIVDEAQNLRDEVLEQLRLLTNLETDKHKLLQIILVGQPELRAKLAQYHLRQLAQRITARYVLKGLNRRETRAYIEHRCRVAGANRPLFSGQAQNWVYRLARGNPRMTNILCDRALLGAYSAGRKQVDADIVRQAAAEIGDSVPGRNWWRPWALTGALTAGLATVAVAGGLYFNNGVVPGTAMNGVVESKLTSSSVQQALAEKAEPALGEFLSSTDIVTDTESAFRALFALWGQDIDSLGERTGCEVASELGLECVFSTGTWNNLRNYNRPAVIELLDDGGGRHHVLLTAMDETSISLRLGDKTVRYPIAEADRYWFGKYLLVWQPPALELDGLRLGMEGERVMWLRETLARFNGEPAEGDQHFDVALEDKVREFQRRHELVADGVVGQFTLMQLNAYRRQPAPPTLFPRRPG